MMQRRVAVLASGRGSNLAALIAAADTGGFPARVALALSNRLEAPALGYARDRGIPAVAVDHRMFGRDRQAHEQAMEAVLLEHGVELVCLAGYMRLLTPWLVQRWAGRMLNIHPSLLPAFPGLRTHERALAAGCRLHGCTVHLVTAATDEGPILAQAAVPVLPGDTADTLAARVLAQEHRIYPAALAAHCGAAADPPGGWEALANPLPMLVKAP